MRRYFYVLPVVLILTGCDRSRAYETPPSLTAQSAATITGSKHHDPNPLAADTRVYIVSIDDKLTGGGAHAWDSNVFLLPGEHVIKIGVYRHSLSGTNVGFGTVTARFQAGQAYFLRAVEPVPVSKTLAQSAVWIEDSGTAVVSAKAPVDVEPFTSGNSMVLMPAGKAKIPMYLPR